MSRCPWTASPHSAWLACGELIVVDWELEHDQQRNEVRRLSTGCAACGIPLTPPD